MRWMFLILLSCSGQEQSSPEPEPKPIVKTFKSKPPASDSEAIPRPEDTPASIDVDLVFSNISSIHRGFFVQSKAVSNLKNALASCFSKKTTVEVGYTSKTLKGRIVLVSNGDLGLCKPVWTQEAVDLQPWIPIGQALAQYRDYVAGTSDFRISNFEVGVRIEKENSSCFWPIQGQHPPDGTMWSMCPSVDGTPVCGNSQAPTQTLKVESIVNAEGLRRCFD